MRPTAVDLRRHDRADRGPVGSERLHSPDGTWRLLVSGQGKSSRDRPDRLGPTDQNEVDRDMSDVSRLPGPMDHAWQWQRLGSCRGMDSGVFFHPDGERNPSRARRTARAKEVCHSCPVMDMCREFALQTREPFGVWGGLAEAERRIILERRGLSVAS
jgi:WhiB family redox-sensing transcriptional regulator